MKMYVMNNFDETINKIVQFFSEGYSSYKNNYLHSSCKSFFWEHPFSSLFGAILGPILFILFLQLLSKESIGSKGIIYESITYGGVLGILMVLGMLVPCLLGANIELTGDIAVGIIYILFLWVFFVNELTLIEQIIMLTFFILFYSGLIFLKHIGE